MFRYILTGGTAAIVDIGGFQVFTLVHIPTVAAASCSFGLATLVNFHLTARWVFRARTDVLRYFLFLGGAVLAGLVNVTITTVAVMYLDLTNVMAKMLAVGLTFFLNFWINAAVVFRTEAG